jgi:hypothetical protein
MPANRVSAQDVPCSLFLGLNTELAPGDLPEGVSPDNQDVAYLPGSVFSRACLTKLYPARAGTTVVYTKSYLQPNGQPLTLILYSDGALYKEDITNSPGAISLIGNVFAGSYCNSITAFGREYLAFSDGLHGVDIPRQFDGTNFDRVSQDGPGAGPTSIADINTQEAISSIVFQDIGTISAISESGTVVTVTTSAPHGLTEVSGFVLIRGVTTAGYNGLYQIESIPTTTTFTVINAGSGLGADTTGTVSLGTIVVTTSTPHGLNVGDAAVISGNSGTLNNSQAQTSGTPTPQFWPVVKVVSPTVFWFALTGPAGTLNTTTITLGTGGNVQTGGLVSVGTHQCVVIFQTRQGYLTKPSPPVSFTCGGNKQIQITGIPIGPPNTVARILAFTGAGGSRYFYIPVNAVIPGVSLLFNGSLAPSTIVPATVLLDNTSTSLIVDFPDNTLFGGIAIDIDGNNLFNLVTLGPCLSFFAYASRLWAWGEVNKVQSFLNMGFEGGLRSGAPAAPLGWTPTGTAGTLVANPAAFGDAWQITGDGVAHTQGGLQQTAYQDINNISILEPNTPYSFRFWAKASAPNLTGTIFATLSSVSAGFTSTAQINANQLSTAGAFTALLNFSLNTPVVIPSDLILTIGGNNISNGATVTIDEMLFIFTEQPYRDSDFRVSYVNNPESFDGVTGDLGPTDDVSPIRCCGILRNTLCFLTGERLHRTQDNKTGEPSTWDVDQVASNCGGFSAMSMTSPETPGEDWLIWAGPAGLRIFEGDTPWKISQEIQSDSIGAGRPCWNAINFAVQQTVWVENDPINRRVYIGLPINGATAPNLIFPMDYRELDKAAQIASSGPIHISFTGKMIASDLARKWTRWNLAMNYGKVITRPGNVKQFVVCAGNGQTPGQASGFGNVYLFDSLKLTDDDYGAVVPYYFSYGFVNHEQEQALQVGSHRKLYAYFSFFMTGTGNVQVTPYADTILNAYPVGPQIQLSQSQTFDWGYGINVDAERTFFKFAITPLLGGTDVQFNLQKLVCDAMPHPVSPVR